MSESWTTSFQRLAGMSESERRLLVRGLAWAFYVEAVFRIGEFRDLVDLVGRRSAGGAVGFDRCREAERAVRRCWRLMPLRGRCLQIAITLALMLREEGADASVRLGVGSDLDRFAAHAWVEVPSCEFAATVTDDWTEVAVL